MRGSFSSGYAGLAGMDFGQFSLLMGIVVLKGLIFVSFFLGGC